MPHSEIDLYAIASEIWGAILGLELKPNNPVDHHDPGERVITGCVQITGDWSGAVTVQCSERFGRTAAALMFAMEPDEVAEDEVTDTIGELANMSGGNVKSLLAGSLQLSLPSVTAGRDYQVSVPGAVVTDRVALDCDGELVAISLLQRQTS